MCGRKYAAEELNWAEYRAILDIVGPDDRRAAPDDNFPPNYNIAPTHQVPVVRAGGDGAGDRAATLTRLQWGLVPRWAKDAKIGYKMINARAETLTEKPSFKNLVARHRCVIPVSGFYEWQRGLGPKGKDKQAHKVARADGAPLLLAGLWTRHAGLGLSSYTVITTAATPAFAPLHHRLPMMLERDQLGAWLTGDWDAARALIQPYAGAIVATPVSNDVGKVANNYPALLDPVAVQAGLI